MELEQHKSVIAKQALEIRRLSDLNASYNYNYDVLQKAVRNNEHLMKVNALLQQRINILGMRNRALCNVSWAAKKQKPTVAASQSVDVKLVKAVTGTKGSLNLFEVQLTADETGTGLPQTVYVVTSYDLQKVKSLCLCIYSCAVHRPT